MFTALRSASDRFFGHGASAITVPTLDGAFRPNNLLDQAAGLVRHPGIDNVVATGEGVLVSSGAALHRLSDDFSVADAIAGFRSPISCVAASPGGQIAVGLESGEVMLLTPGSPSSPQLLSTFKCPVALAFSKEDRLVVANGSENFAAPDWKRDFMARTPSGSLQVIALPALSVRTIASGLGFPWGLAVSDDGRIVFSEAWGYGISSIGIDGGKPSVLIGDLPGYPMRIARAANGHHFVSFICVRRQLTEFVLSEKEFRERMTTQIDPAFWIGPTFVSGRSFREPMQQGSLKALNIIKPWAPTQSYGLVAEFDAGFTPLRSFQSRADGRRHGISALACHGADLLLVSRACDEVLQIPAITEPKS